MTKTRKPIIAGNWKMHGTRASTAELLNSLKNKVTNNESAEMVIFPPFTFLEQTESILKGSSITWGAQNCADELTGAYTGEVSVAMLKEYGCHYVLVGHSERRSLYDETNEIIAKKFMLAQQAGLQPVLCVGETVMQRQTDQALTVVGDQLEVVLDKAGGVGVLQNAVLAYEPVWAIGTGLTATPEQAQEIHAFLRQQVAQQDPTIAENLCILYGGSVKAANAAALFAMPDIDGGLVGGASLDAQEFLQIYHSLCNN